MKILLDYLFPITAIEPTAAASTAFLKQVCVIGKPKDGGVTTGVISLCTTQTAVDALLTATGAAEVAELLSAGMSRVYILPLDDLTDAAAVLVGSDAADFYTVLITSDFSDDDIGTTSGGVKAYLKIQDITFTAKTVGTGGNSITINYNSGGTAGSEVVGVSGSAITVTMEDGVSTAAQLKTAIENSVPAAALVDVAVDVGDETDKQAVFGAAVPLAHGAAASAGDLDLGDFNGVVGVSSDDDTFLATQAAISKRCGFHVDSANGAKNLFFAFGSLLSNQLNWLNQQYIAMPVDDGVDTVGDAEALFDDRISFVISDDQYSKRLAMFACGGKAIVAPYIVRNLQIDLQSKALQYISANEPGYTKTQAALLEDELQKVIQGYIDDKLLEAGVIEVSLAEDNFVASGEINISEPKALWRILGEMRQTL